MYDSAIKHCGNVRFRQTNKCHPWDIYVAILYLKLVLQLIQLGQHSNSKKLGLYNILLQWECDLD